MVLAVEHPEQFDILYSLEILITSISRRLEVEELEIEYLRSIASLIPAHATALYFFQPGEAKPLRIAAKGVDEGFLSYYETTGRELDPLRRWITANLSPYQSQLLLGLEGWQLHPVYRVVGTANIDFAMQSPILFGPDIIGTLNFGRTVKEGPFSKPDLTTVSILSKFLSLAIANSLGNRNINLHQKQFSYAMDRIQHGIVITDADYSVQYANNAAKGLAVRAFGPDKPVEQLSDLIRDECQHKPRSKDAQRRKLATRHCQLPGSHTQQTLVLLNEIAPEATINYLKNILTQREIDVLQLVERGLHNQDIADRLCISTNTVKRHLDNIYCKLDVNSRIELLGKIYRLAREG
jgi:DNA-binding NarL/FixJ family response regulator